MVIKNINCTLEERISTKSGNKYKALVIKLTDTYEKLVMLDKAEIELVELTLNKPQNNLGK